LVDDNSGNNRPDSPGQKRPGWYHVIGSVLAAGFGVQSKKNRERDFQHGKPVIFIITGLVFTILFISAVIMVVNTVLEKAG
jgi:hypothetical protein